MIQGTTAETIWVSPTRDNANAGTGNIANLVSGGSAVTFAGGMVSGDWLDDTTSDGVRCLATARSSGKYLNVAINHGLGISYPWWISYWVYHTTSVADPHVVLRSAGRFYNGIGQAAGVDRVVIFNGASWASYTGGAAPALSLNTWNHVVLQVFSAGLSWVYINGVYAGALAYGNTLLNADTLNLMGRSDYATATLGGRFDDFRGGSGIIGSDAITWLNGQRGRTILHRQLTGGL